MYNIVVGQVSGQKLLAVVIRHNSQQAARIRALKVFDFVGPVRIVQTYRTLKEAEIVERDLNAQYKRIEARIARLQQYAAGRG